MKPILERTELMEYAAWAFTSGLNGILLDFDKMKAACMADFSRRLGSGIPDDAMTYINRVYNGLADVYELGRQRSEKEASGNGCFDDAALRGVCDARPGE